MSPTVSICIPAYKEPAYLKRALDSVAIQSYLDYEVIVTDDSPDDLVQKVAEQFPLKDRLKYYKNVERKGSPGNWVEAVRHATGKYIKILHHDDCFCSENSLYQFVLMLDQNRHADFAFSASTISDCTGDTRFHAPTAGQLEGLTKDPKNLFPYNFIGAPSATIFRAKGVVEFDINLRWVVDIDFYIRYLLLNRNYVFNETPLVTVHVGQHQVTSECLANKELLLFEWVYTYKKFFPRFLLKFSHLKFFRGLFKGLKVKHRSELINAGCQAPIPLVVTTVFILQRFLLLLQKPE